jgi:hypothetical protein
MTHNEYLALDRALTELAHTLYEEMGRVKWPQREAYFYLRDDVLEVQRETYRAQMPRWWENRQPGSDDPAQRETVLAW